MRKRWKNQISFVSLFSVFASGFLLMSLLDALSGDMIPGFFQAENRTTELLIRQLALWAGFSVFLWIAGLVFPLPPASLFLTVSAIAYLSLFAWKSPAPSLGLGAMLMAFPFAVCAVVAWFGKKGREAIPDRVMAGLALAGFLFIVGFLIFKEPLPVSDYPWNDSMISPDPLYSDFQKGLWKYGLQAGFLFAVLLVTGDLLHWGKRTRKVLGAAGWALDAVVLLAHGIGISLIMVYRTKILGTPTYDFGIFSQMFFNMARSGTMVTTLERGIELSHLAVHFSPVYYLFLPAFLLFPFPETLQVLQVLIVVAAALPLSLLMRELKTPPLLRTLILAAYLAHPALVTGAYYDLHENCFLPFFLFFLFYFLQKRQIPGIAVCAILVLLVKEDAFVYAAMAGIHLVFSAPRKPGEKRGWKIAVGTGLLLLSAGWFLLVSQWMKSDGQGVMFWRYDNLMVYPEGGLPGLVAGILQNPRYFLSTLFAREKMITLFWCLCCLGFLPLAARRPADYLLFIPLIILNLASNYPYQHQFGFQYYYGSIPFLIYLAVLAESGWRETVSETTGKWIRRAMAAFLAVGLSVGTVFAGESAWARRYDYLVYQENTERYESMKQTLESLPKNSRVAATGLLTTCLSDHYYLYDFDYYSTHLELDPVDFVVIDLRLEEASLNRFRTRALNAGYVLSDRSTPYILVYERPSA